LKTPYPHIENCDTLDVDMVREMQPIIGMWLVQIRFKTPFF
jgi:hypothetical protein